MGNQSFYDRKVARARTVTYRRHNFSSKFKREASYNCSFQCCRKRSWKVFETNLGFIYCSGIAVTEQIKKCIDIKLSLGTTTTSTTTTSTTATTG